MPVFNLKKYYLEAKILIFPSLYEGLPNTLIEAVNYNLPCISSRCSGAVDILSNRYGIFISNNQSIQLSNKMVDSILNYKKTLSNTQMIKKKLSRFLIKPQVLKYTKHEQTKTNTHMQQKQTLHKTNTHKQHNRAPK